MASTVDLSEIQEFEDKPQVLRTKVESLTKMIQAAQHFICFTGAGLSTAANIPDYRGPDGAWTRKAQGRAPPRGTSFGAAKPTFSHNLLAQWCQTGRLDHIVSQNVDGLHRRSGVAAENISELHGNSFLEKCWKCSASYLRDAPVRQRSNAKNGGRCRECSKRVPHFCHCTNNSCEKCGAALKDSIIHFKENLPEEDLECAFEHAELADLCVVVGSSCRVTPAADIPQRVGQRGKNLVIINKQATPLDSLAKLVIHADIDTVFGMVEEELHAQSAHAQRTATSAAADPTPGAAAMDPVTAVPGRAVSSGFDEPGVADVHEQIPVQDEAEDWGLALGNTHSEEQTGSGEATHKWTLYLSAVGADAPSLDGTVERCEFHLHPTFQPSSVTVSQAPFSITRKGWGTFTVFADVYFSASSGLAPVRLEHSLDFSGSEALGSVEVVHRAAPTLLSE